MEKRESWVWCIHKGEGKHSESLVSILYLVMVVDVLNSQSSGKSVFYCKGNLTLLMTFSIAFIVMRGERYGRGGKPSCSGGGYEFGA